MPRSGTGPTRTAVLTAQPTLRRRLCVGALLASTAVGQAPCFDLDVGTDLDMFDDQIVAGLALGFTFTFDGVGYTSVCLDSNGSIYLGATTTATSDFSPTEAELLSSPQPRICGLWDDFNAGALGSGHIYFNAVPAVGGNLAHALFTWAGVWEYGRTTPIQVQVKLDANNAVTVTYGATAPLGGMANTTLIIGASPGLGAVSNPVSFATRPVLIMQNNFADVRTVPNTPAGFKMLLTPISPGYFAMDITCTPNTIPPAGRTEVLGVGCPPASKPSIYELFTATNPVDVSGMNFTFLPNGAGGYTVVRAIGGPFFTGFTAGLNAGNDTTHPVALPFPFPHGGGVVNNIVVSSNGFLTLGTVNNGAGCCAGSVSALLSGESCIAAWWSDLNPVAPGPGEVYADLDNASGEFVVTWSQVPEFFSTGSNTFQIALSPNGSFRIRLLSVARATHDFLLGYSYGHGARPNAVDMSAIAATDIGALLGPLAIAAAAGSRPALGSTYTMNVTGIAPTPRGNAAMLFLGFTELNPGIDLGALLGAPGCSAFLLPGPNDLSFLNSTSGAPTTSFSVTLPRAFALFGVQGIAEAVSDDTSANAFGWRFSNGLRLTVGI